MLLLADLIVDQTSLLQIDLVDQLQAATFADCPDRATGRREGGHHFVEHRVIELGGRSLAARQLRDFLDEPLNLALCALDLFSIHRRGAG